MNTRRVPFVLNLDDPLDAAIWNKLEPMLGRRRASAFIRLAVAQALDLDPLVNTEVRSPQSIERNTRGYVYLIKSVTGLYKIGRSKDLTKRLDTFGVKLPFEIELQHTIKSDNYIEAERLLHQRFADRRVNGEWFSLTDADVNHIMGIHELNPDVDAAADNFLNMFG